MKLVKVSSFMGISDEIDNTTIAIDEATILEIKATILSRSFIFFLEIMIV